MPESSTNPYQPPASEVPGSGVSNNTVLITAETFLQAQQIHFGWRLHVGRVLRVGFGLFFIVFAALYLLSNLNTAFAIPLIVLGVWLCYRGLFQNLRILGAHRKRFQEMGKERGDSVAFEPGPEVLRITTEDVDLSMKWSSFVKWKEQDGLILAYINSKSFQVIPVAQLDEKTRQGIRQNLEKYCQKA